MMKKALLLSYLGLSFAGTLLAQNAGRKEVTNEEISKARGTLVVTETSTFEPIKIKSCTLYLSTIVTYEPKKDGRIARAVRLNLMGPAFNNNNEEVLIEYGELNELIEALAFLTKTEKEWQVGGPESGPGFLAIFTSKNSFILGQYQGARDKNGSVATKTYFALSPEFNAQIMQVPGDLSLLKEKIEVCLSSLKNYQSKY